MLSRIPCWYGYTPVRIVACDGSVRTVEACANVKRAPCAASRSRFGVAAGPPYELSASARSVSIVTSRTFASGVAGRTKAWSRHHHQTPAPIAATTTIALAIVIGRGVDRCGGALGVRERFAAGGRAIVRPAQYIRRRRAHDHDADARDQHSSTHGTLRRLVMIRPLAGAHHGVHQTSSRRHSERADHVQRPHLDAARRQGGRSLPPGRGANCRGFDSADSPRGYHG